jgi:hypothetical protein
VGVSSTFRDLSPLSAPRRNSLKSQISPIAVYYIYRSQANGFDGKSDGKNFSVILFLIFTVKPDLNLFKSLQIAGFFALQITGLGNS